MKYRQQTSLQERLAISALSAAGQTDPEIAAALGCAVATVRKWRRIAQRHGRAALTSRMGRPAQGALATLPAPLIEAIRHLRQTHPGWGPTTLLAELRRQPRFCEQRLPSRARLAAFLRQEGLTRRYQKHRKLPQPDPDAPSAPHEEWQLDAQGTMEVAGVGSVCVVNVADVLSRVKVESYPTLSTSQPSTADYQLVLRRAFVSYGLPERISFDHGGAFFDNTCRSPFPTRLHLWLIGLGVAVLFTRVRTPTDHALVERMHQTMTLQALLGQSWADAAALWAGLDERREQLNTVLPTQALGVPPLTAYPEAVRSGRSYRPEWEAEMLELERVFAYLAHGQWFRQSNCQGEWWLGAQRYNLGRRYARREVEVTFDPATVEFVCRPEGSEATIRFAAKGLSKEDLMGELATLLALPAYQLALPFSREAWRQLELARCMAATTL